MSAISGLEAAAGVLLVFFVPGYAVVKATFPDWRLRGPTAALRALEIGALAFVLSVTLTVLVGFVLLRAGPAGFQAAWSDPELEAGLGIVALAAFVIGWWEGAYRREPPVRAPNPVDEEAGAWELSRELERLRREERRLLHRVRVAGDDAGRRADSERELASVRERVAELQRVREAEYAR